MNEYLVFHLYGPFASFGDIAVGEYRPSYDHPSKSGIIGLISAALGIRRDEEERLQRLYNSLCFGVLVLSAGTLLNDYHTIQVPSAASIKKQPVHSRKDELNRKDLNTILSNREYRMDAAYRVALWNRNKDNLLSDIKKALKKPKFSVYMGRKSCPLAVPMDPELVKAKSVRDALVKTRGKMEAAFLSVLRKNIFWDNTDSENSFPLYQDDESGANLKGLKKIKRKDRLISRKAWQFGDREEQTLIVEGTDVF